MSWPLRTSTLIGILALIVWGCILVAGVVIYVRYSDPRQLALLIRQRFAAETNLAWTIDRVDVGFFPEPHARLRDVTIQHPDARLDVPEVTAFMGWAGLLGLRFAPQRVVLENPALTVSRPPLAGASPSVLPIALRGMRLIVRRGHMAIDHPDFGVVVRNCNASVRLPGASPGSLEMRGDELSVSRQARHAGGLSDFRLWARNIRLPEQADEKIDLLEAGLLEGALSLPGIGDRLELRLHLSKENDNPLAGRLDVRGDLAAVPPVPLRLNAPFTLTGAGEVRLPDVELALDADAATLDAVLTPGGASGAFLAAFSGAAAAAAQPESASSAPSLRGTARIRRLSLPRWFAFARDLPPGIEAALDALSGEADFTLTPRSLTVPRLRADICGIAFAGEGGVSDFGKPVIRIAAHTDTADVNAVFPELLRRGPKAMVWPGPPLVAQNAGGEGPDYTIRLTAAHASIWKFAVTRFAFHCSPLPGGSRLDIGAQGFYGGSFASTVDIEDRVTITASLTQAALDTPAALVAGEPVLGGRLTGKAALSGSGESFDHFLASLEGVLQGQITNGWLAGHGGKEKNAFNAMEFTFKAAGPGLNRPHLPPLLPFTGTWNVRLRTENREASCDLRGALELDSASLSLRHMRDVPGRLQWSGEGLSADLEAQFDFDRDKDTLHVRNAAGKVNGGTIAGALAGSGLFAPPPEAPHTVWQGTLRLTTTALRSILDQRGLTLPDMPDNALRHLDLRGDFTLAGSRIQARNLSGRLDDTTFSGSILHDPADTHAWQADLALGALNLGRYLPRSQSGASPWSVKLLDSLSARGVVRLDSLAVAKLVQRSVRIPFVIENKVLTCAPISFIPYNGRGEAELRLEVSPVGASPAGYRTRLRYAANSMDTALLSREAGFTTILGGKAALTADVTGLLRQGADFPQALDGTWSVAIADGFIGENRTGAGAQSVPFRSIGASGVMRQGILHTQDISMKGRELAASGKASINLVDWTLNCRLNVSTRSFSNVPVEYTGSLDAPERSINALYAVAGAIGKLGSGLFGLVEDVLSTPFRLLR